MNKVKVPFLNLKKHYFEYQDEFERSILNSFRSGRFIGGEEVIQFEEEFANFTNSNFCVGVSNGLDALFLSLISLGIGEGDEVLVPSNTFIATWLAVSLCGAKPIPVEPDINTQNINPQNIEKFISHKTRAIIPVHLYGEPADLDSINFIAKKNNLYVIEDAAQAHGTKYKNQPIGSHSDLVAWSFYPGKNLGAFGDGGAVTTSNADLFEKICLLRNYGSSKRYEHIKKGYNCRLDPVQAAVLKVKLNYIEKLNMRRKKIAKIYNSELSKSNLILPHVSNKNSSSWHLYCIRSKNRNFLMEYLSKKGIETLIHYPIPPHLQKAYAHLGYRKGDFPISEMLSEQLLSLPIDPFMTDEQVIYVIEKIQEALLENY